MWPNHLSTLHETHLSNYLWSSLVPWAAWLQRIILKKKIKKWAHTIAPSSWLFLINIFNEDLFTYPETENFKVNKRSGALERFQENENTLAKVYSSVRTLKKKSWYPHNAWLLCIFTLTSVLANQFFIKAKMLSSDLCRLFSF